jgi:hypothetical protein
MSSRRIRREKKTIATMIGMYCHDRHGTAPSTLCDDCDALNEYAMQRIDKCPFCLDKPTCANCTIHCYKDDMREQVRGVMRYAGPRMMRRHPVLAVLHVLDGFRSTELPERKGRGSSPVDA